MSSGRVHLMVADQEKMSSEIRRVDVKTGIRRVGFGVVLVA